MTITITHLEGPLAGQTHSFDDDVTEIKFGRSGGGDVVFPLECDTVGGDDMKLVRTGPGTYQVTRIGQHYLEIDGRPIPVDLNNIPIASGSVIRLGGRGGPSFRVVAEKPKRAGPFRTATTKAFEKVNSVTQQLAEHRHALIAGFLGFGLALAGIVYYQVVYVPQRYTANIEHLLNNTYLVVRTNPNGKKESAATAFVIGNGKQLATNAHVTEAIRAAPGKFYLQGPAGKRIEIKEVDTHPAYKLFQFKKWTLGEKKSGGFEHVPLQGAYDVGVITVNSAKPLSEKPLKVAPAEDIVALEPGTKLIAAGFPSEDIVAADNATKGDAVPLLSSGEIRAVDDIFRTGDTKSERRLLVVHDIPVAGGVSGSPVLDAWTGEVVAVISGGNVVTFKDSRTGEAKRTPNAAMVNFAQRADLLSAMLDEGAAAKDLAAQKAYWDEAGKSFDQYDDYVREQFIAHAKDAYALDDREGTRLGAGSLTPAGNGKRAFQSMTFKAEPGFVYGLLAILSGDRNSQGKIDIGIYENGTRLKTTQSDALANDAFTKGSADEMPTAWVRVGEPTELEVKLNGFIDEPVDYELYLYSWPAHDASVADTPASVTAIPAPPDAAPQQ
jgi:hypothetical protein